MRYGLRFMSSASVLGATLLAVAAGLFVAGRCAAADPSCTAQIERRVQVWCEPVYRTVCDDVWTPPVYRVVCDRVWHEPVYRVEREQLWVPDRYEVRDIVRYDLCGCRTITQERVLVEPAHYEIREHQVLVSAGHFEDVERQVCVCEGHYDHVTRQELVTPGHYEWRTELVQAVVEP